VILRVQMRVREESRMDVDRLGAGEARAVFLFHANYIKGGSEL
jgi:hypothetical protein